MIGLCCREAGRVLYNATPEEDWYTDQVIITWALLSSKVCSVPASSNLWKMPGLQFDPALDDTERCFHGVGYQDCNRGRSHISLGCKWWHFYPSESFENHLDKFYQFSNNTVTLDPDILAEMRNNER